MPACDASYKALCGAHTTASIAIDVEAGQLRHTNLLVHGCGKCRRHIVKNSFRTLTLYCEKQLSDSHIIGVTAHDGRESTRDDGVERERL